MRIFSIFIMLLFASVSYSETWQQANKDSAAFLKAQKPDEAEQASKRAIELY